MPSRRGGSRGREGDLDLRGFLRLGDRAGRDIGFARGVCRQGRCGYRPYRGRVTDVAPDFGNLLDRDGWTVTETEPSTTVDATAVADKQGQPVTGLTRDDFVRILTEPENALTLQYNRARQAAITTELMEIIGGAEALKG